MIMLFRNKHNSHIWLGQTREGIYVKNSSHIDINDITCAACKGFGHSYQLQEINIYHSPYQGQVALGIHNGH